MRKGSEEAREGAVDLFPERLYLYGSGGFAEDVWHLCQRSGINVEGILEFHEQRIDKAFPHGGHVARSAYEAMRDHPLPVLLAIHNPYADIHRIASGLEELGCPLVLTPLQLYSELRLRGIEAPSRYWLAGTTEVDPIAVGGEPLGISALRSRLSDPESSDCLDAVLAWRQSGSWRDSPHPRAMEEQYCSTDVPLPRERISFVDVGAFTGDTIQNMASRGFSFDRVLALEPDPTNFPALLDTLGELGVPSSALAVGAGRETTILRFNASGTSSSVVTADGDTSIQVQRLDDLLIRQRVDYIKMDIEGGEYGAIEGLEQVISSQAPALAISAYHKPTDLLTIPKLLLQLQPDYCFYLRTYAQMSFETVLYAVRC